MYFLRYLKYTSYRLNIKNNLLPYKRDRTASLTKKAHFVALTLIRLIIFRHSAACQGPTFTCPRCGKLFPPKNTFDKHTLLCGHDLSNFQCETCKKLLQVCLFFSQVCIFRSQVCPYKLQILVDTIKFFLLLVTF